jgi:aminoglycoside phosphotransferase (APT) family kinase protein
VVRTALPGPTLRCTVASVPAASDIDPDDLLARCTTAARRTWADARVEGLRRLEGGVSSLTFASSLLVHDESRPVVLKVAPPGLAPVRNRDVLRQASVLRALEGRDGFPVPPVLFTDPGQPPEVPPLFAMGLLPGESYEALLDVTAHPPAPEVAAERMHVAARALARLQSCSPAAYGLEAEPVSTVRDELDRWVRLFETVDADIGPGWADLADRLAERVPDGVAPTLLHGDYRVANMLFAGDRLEAVIDWEIWSVGDPRSDLAWLLMHTAPAQMFHEERPAADVLAGSLVPAPHALLATYAGARRDLGAPEADVDAVTRDLDWFLAVCHFKTASTIAVIWKRERKGERPSERMGVAAAHLSDVLRAGHRALDVPALQR